MTGRTLAQRYLPFLAIGALLLVLQTLQPVQSSKVVSATGGGNGSPFAVGGGACTSQVCTTNLWYSPHIG